MPLSINMHPYTALNNPALSPEQRIEAALKGVSHRTQMRFALWCARSVKHLMKDQRSKDALDILERYIDGHATKEEMELARNAAYASADATAADAAYAAYASADATSATSADASAAYAAHAAYSAYYAASATAFQVKIREAQIAKLIELMKEEPLW